jgi:outer membrane receptor protein involved in Fe transport
MRSSVPLSRLPFLKSSLDRRTVAARVLVHVLCASSLPFSAVAQQVAVPTQNRETIVELPAFAVTSDPDDSYEALNTSSLSGTNKALEKLPISAEVINQTLMSDLGTSDVKEILNKYATAITPGENSPGSSTAEGRGDGDRFTLFTLGVRGLNACAARRNGFLTFGYLSEGFSTERMEIIRGPQALIYGTNPPGGVVNITSKKALFGTTRGSVQAMIDEEGSERFQLDLNAAGKLLDRNAAIRVSLLDADINYWRHGIGRETTGRYAEAAYEIFPESRTQLRLEYENIEDYAVEPSPRRTIFGINTGRFALGVPDGTPLSVLLATNHPAVGTILDGKLSWENVDSIAGSANATKRRQEYFAATLSSRITPWLEGQIIAAKAPRWTRRLVPGSIVFRAPLTGPNPLDAWAVNYRPVINPIVDQENEGLRAVFSADFDITSHSRHNLVFGGELTNVSNDAQQCVYYQADSSGNVLVNPNPALVNTADRGRTHLPVQWLSLADGLPNWADIDLDRYTINGTTYVLDKYKTPNPALAAPGNPLGLNGGTAGASTSESSGSGAFAALFSTFLGGKVETLLGMRFDERSSANITSGGYLEGEGYSGNAGIIWRATNPVSVYASFSRNFNPDSSGALLWTGEPLPSGIGRAYEGGLKLNAFDGRLSGTLAYYHAESINEVERIAATTRAATDPSGINGNHYDFFLPSINFDRQTKGVELSITARPLPNWRLQAGYSHNLGREGSSVFLPFYYNDEFRTDAQGRVLVADNTPLLVPVNPATPVAADGRTYAAGVSTQALTVDMLRNGDAAGNYRALVAPDNGRIQNAVDLGLRVPGVGTGRTGLPISQHQLGFRPSVGDSILARGGGERTTGYPLHAFTLTSMYGFSRGKLQGLALGVNASLSYDTILYYYNDSTAGNERRKFFAPDQARFNLIASYTRKITKKISWKTQINLNNLTDERYMTILPNVATGANDNAALMASPRTWVWTNTVSF